MWRVAAGLSAECEEVGVRIGDAQNGSLDELGRDHAEGDAVAAIAENGEAALRARNLADRRESRIAAAETAGPGEVRLRIHFRKQLAQLALDRRDLARDQRI